MKKNMILLFTLATCFAGNAFGQEEPRAFTSPRRTRVIKRSLSYQRGSHLVEGKVPDSPMKNAVKALQRLEYFERKHGLDHMAPEDRDLMDLLRQRRDLQRNPRAPLAYARVGNYPVDEKENPKHMVRVIRSFAGAAFQMGVAVGRIGPEVGAEAERLITAARLAERRQQEDGGGAGLRRRAVAPGQQLAAAAVAEEEFGEEFWEEAGRLADAAQAAAAPRVAAPAVDLEEEEDAAVVAPARVVAPVVDAAPVAPARRRAEDEAAPRRRKRRRPAAALPEGQQQLAFGQIGAAALHAQQQRELASDRARAREEAARRAREEAERKEAKRRRTAENRAAARQRRLHEAAKGSRKLDTFFG